MALRPNTRPRLGHHLRSPVMKLPAGNLLKRKLDRLSGEGRHRTVERFEWENRGRDNRSFAGTSALMCVTNSRVKISPTNCCFFSQSFLGERDILGM